MIIGEPVVDAKAKRESKLLGMWASMGQAQQDELIRRAKALLWLQDHPIICRECGQPTVLLEHFSPKIRVPFICRKCKDES